MNHSIYSADRATHLRIVIVALVAAIAGLGASLHFQSSLHSHSNTAPAGTAFVLKTGKLVAVSSSAIIAR